ncbi:MAG TPA: hypothetical protein ENJ46_03700 [Hellea balneolensis]|uniref:Blue (type 1) copper domain-containing protein n=1 Tax=Hellea balneolensis TaxID=287478 RepID=A0A7C3C9G3_9PROT|nr:hypothetical protein [Hellea balneolensis]
MHSKTRISFIVLAVMFGASLLTYLMAGAHPVPATDVHERQDTIPQTYRIDIHKMKFQTPRLDVRVGDKVTWTNKDIVPHTATATDESWSSGRLKKGESFTLTITEHMSLDYFCSYHRTMKGVLVVPVTPEDG